MAPLQLSGCSQVQIKDEIFYGNKGMLGAVEFHTLTTGTKEISFEDWMKLIRNNALICSSVDTFGDAKVAFEQLCSVCNCCTADTTAAVDKFFENVNQAQRMTKP